MPLCRPGTGGRNYRRTGRTAIEYGLIAGLMAALLIGVLTGFSDKLGDLFSAISPHG